MRIVVVGISTDVGKTVVSALLVEALGASYWKPVQTGEPLDRTWVEQMTGRFCFPESYAFCTPCSPHLAARLEGRAIGSFTVPQCERLVIEGAGGILTPLDETRSWVDVAAAWEAQWVLVHRHYLGSLTHFLLTASHLKERKIPLLGVVFNGDGDRETEEMLLKRAQTRCLGRLSWQAAWSPEKIRSLARSLSGI